MIKLNNKKNLINFETPEPSGSDGESEETRPYSRCGEKSGYETEKSYYDAALFDLLMEQQAISDLLEAVASTKICVENAGVINGGSIDADDSLSSLIEGLKGLDGEITAISEQCATICMAIQTEIDACAADCARYGY